MADPLSTSVIVSGIGSVVGSIFGRGSTGQGFKRTFEQAVALQRQRNELDRIANLPPTTVPGPDAALPPEFTQVQGDVTGFGTETPADVRESLLEEILRRTGPRGVVPVQGGASGRGGAGAPGRGGGGGQAPRTPAKTRKEMGEELERVTRGVPTPNLPAVVTPRVGPPVPRKIPEGFKIGAKEKAAIATGIIGSAVIGSGGIIRVGPPRPGQPPPETVGPFPPGQDPGEIGPFPAPPEQEDQKLEEITVSARRRTVPQTARGLPGGVQSPPVVTRPTIPGAGAPRGVPRSVLLGILSASSFFGASQGARQTAQAVSAPTAVPRPSAPPVPQVAPGQFFAPPSRPSDTRTRSCDKPARKNRKTCWEGFYSERTNSTNFTRWTKVDCRTRKIIEEK